MYLSDIFIVYGAIHAFVNNVLILNDNTITVTNLTFARFTNK